MLCRHVQTMIGFVYYVPLWWVGRCSVSGDGMCPCSEIMSVFKVVPVSAVERASTLGFSCAFTLHTPGIRPLCAYKYSEVCELSAALKHQSSLYTQCLEVGLAERITTILVKKKGKKGRPHNMEGASWTWFLSGTSVWISTTTQEWIHQWKLPLDNTMIVKNRGRNTDMMRTA